MTPFKFGLLWLHLTQRFSPITDEPSAYFTYAISLTASASIDLNMYTTATTDRPCETLDFDYAIHVGLYV